MSRIDEYKKLIAQYEARPAPTMIRCVSERNREQYSFRLDQIKHIQRYGERDKFFIHVENDDRTFIVDSVDGIRLSAWLEDVTVQDHYEAKLRAGEAAKTIEILEREG